MAEENVEIVRRWFDALSERSEDIRTSVTKYWDADADYYPARKFPDARPCHGLEEIARFHTRFLDAWLRLDFAIQEMLVEVADDRVLARTALLGEGRGSGMKLEGDLYTCVWLRHGRFFRVEDHLTLSGALHALGLRGDALEAAGLSE